MSITIKLERNTLKPTNLEFEISMDSTKLHMTIDSNNFVKNNKIACSCLTTKGTQVYVEFTKTPGCDCVDHNKKIQYKKKEEKFTCFTPSMIKVTTDKYMPGMRLTTQILLALKSENISVHWQKNVTYQPISMVSKDSYISAINLGSAEGSVIEKKFADLTTMTLFVDDNGGEITPYTISYNDPILNQVVLTLPHKYLCEKIENKSVKEMIDPAEFPALFARGEKLEELRNKSLEEKEKVLENAANSLRNKIEQFVNDDKKEGDKGGGN